jgi:hypothetical protein
VLFRCNRLGGQIPSAQPDRGLGMASGKFDGDNSLFSAKQGDIILAVAGGEDARTRDGVLECELDHQRWRCAGVGDLDCRFAFAAARSYDR